MSENRWTKLRGISGPYGGLLGRVFFFGLMIWFCWEVVQNMKYSWLPPETKVEEECLSSLEKTLKGKYRMISLESISDTSIKKISENKSYEIHIPNINDLHNDNFHVEQKEGDDYVMNGVSNIFLLSGERQSNQFVCLVNTKKEDEFYVTSLVIR